MALEQGASEEAMVAAIDMEVLHAKKGHMVDAVGMQLGMEEMVGVAGDNRDMLMRKVIEEMEVFGTCLNEVVG